MTSPWIISRREDLLWFQGSVLAGVALLAIFALAPPLDNDSFAPGNFVVLVVLLWGIFFDGTHVWGTYARSYLAPDAASRTALPRAWSWGLLAVGPVLAVADALWCAPARSQLAQAGWLFRSFLLVAYLWAYWHLVRQHYGFLVLYRRRAGEICRCGGRFDTVLLWTGCLYPYLRFALTPPYAASGLPQVVPEDWLAAAPLGVDIAFGIVMALLLVVMISGQLEPFRPGPKHLLLVIVIAFHIAVFGFLQNLLTITATLTIFHNLQYHRIVWQYERGLGRAPSGGLIPYLALGTVLGIAWYGPRVLGVAALHDDLARNVLLGLGWGVAMHHYLVDGYIWRVRRTVCVAQALDAGAQQAT